MNLMRSAGRDPSPVLNRRSCSSQSCFSGSHTSQHLPPSAAWILQIMGLLLAIDLMGLMDQQIKLASPQPNNDVFPNCFRSCLPSPLVVLKSFGSHLIALQEVLPAIAFAWWFDSLYLIFHLRVKTQRNMETVIFPFHLGAFELPRYQNSSCRGQREIACPLPRYQNSSCRGQREIACPPPRYQNSSCRGQRETVFPILLLEGENCSIIILIFMALVCCASRPRIERIFKGSAKVAVSMIVISALVAVSIANNRSLCVLFVSQGIVSLTSSKIVKVRRLPDDIYGLSVKIACIYPVIFHICVFRLPFEAAMTLLSFVVTNSSFYGE